MLDGFSAMEYGTLPAADDVTVCAYCSQVLQFNADLSLREAHIDAICDSTLGLSQAQQVVKRFQQMNNPPDE